MSSSSIVFEYRSQRMRNDMESWPTTCIIIAYAVVGLSSFSTTSADITCLKEERSSLLALKQAYPAAPFMSSWKGFNCCEWERIECDKHTSHVIKLDLSHSNSTAMEVSPALFELRHLKYLDMSFNSLKGRVPAGLFELKQLEHLDLSNNDFGGRIPEVVGSLKRLTYLNLFLAGTFHGMIPSQIGNLSLLQFLDLSVAEILQNDDGLAKQPTVVPSCSSLGWIRNMSALTYLAMDGVDMSRTVESWGESISYLHNLQHLHMSLCQLSGPIPGALRNLTFLSSLHLSFNSISSTIPAWLQNITALVFLHLGYCELSGDFPLSLARLPRLENLILSGNPITGNVGEILSSGWPHLARLDLRGISFSLIRGSIPSSVGNISSLSYLDLRQNQIEGFIPPSIGQLSSLAHFDLSENQIEGFIPPSIGQLSSLTYLDLTYNKLSGFIPPSIGKLSSLTYLYLSGNQIEGFIPPSIGQLSSLTYLDLSRNELSGNIPTTLGLLSNLQDLDLCYNELSGSIPTTLGLLSNLQELDLSYNKLQGNLSFNHFQNLTSLVVVDLSHNPLNVYIAPTWIPPFQLDRLSLSSCNIGDIIPTFLSTQYTLESLDLSNCKLVGNITNWLADLPSLRELNVSCNSLEGQLPPNLNLSQYWRLDLHGNQLEGPLPFTSRDAHEILFLDFSQNQFSGPIRDDIGKAYPSLDFLSLSTNNLIGDIPSSIGNMQQLQVLDLSNNGLSGKIPSSIFNCSALIRLNLANISLQGKIPRTIGMLSRLKSLHLEDNGLRGDLPLTLKSCKQLQILDVGNNRMSGKIPTWLEQLSELQILVMMSNDFQGQIPSELSNLKNLQILDLSNNNLSGAIPPNLGKLEAMQGGQTLNHTRMITESVDDSYYYYKEGVWVVNKGQDLEYINSVLWLMTCIDLSGNRLTGDIPYEFGNLNNLHGLNISRNNLRGHIPITFGKMIQLESLDLSHNQLCGTIPTQMLVLNYLEVFHVSDNKLSGKIPRGGQFSTFNAADFSNNQDLCGFPLDNNCSIKDKPGVIPYSPRSVGQEDEGIEEEDEITWYWWVGLMAGHAVGFWGVFLTLIVKKEWSRRFFQVLDKIAIGLVNIVTGRR